MEVDTPARADRPVKDEDDAENAVLADDKPTYRSWKKKYRKMRIVFDQKMHEGEELHRLEEKALATARRLAIAKDRLLDLLLDNNNCPQIPPEKRFDLSLGAPDDDDGDALYLDIDLPSHEITGPKPAKSYKKLLQEVRHHTHATAGHLFPELVSDLDAGRDSPADPSQGIPHPPSFLTADDLDNYLWEVDNRIAAKKAAQGGIPAPPWPTLAPLAHANGGGGGGVNGTANGARDGGPPASTSRDFVLRNPVSVYNWLRKHAPKTFLQDGETHPSAHADKENGDDSHTTTATTARGSARGARGERGAAGARSAGGSTRSKRNKSIAAADEYDDDKGCEAATPSGGAAGKGKRKRVTDDDAGYRPKGGSSRPTKKKRKSEGVEVSTPTAPAKRSRKSGGGDGGVKDE